MKTLSLLATYTNSLEPFFIINNLKKLYFLSKFFFLHDTKFPIDSS